MGEKSSSKSRFSSGDAPGRVDADAVVTPLLARANLLKMRGQWEEAVAVCTDAIRRSPNSATAHALLGDIYLAQGKGGDALHWYRMALDRNPSQTGLAEKHDRLLAEQRAVATGGFSATQLGGANRTLVPGEGRPITERTVRIPTGTFPVLAPRTSGSSPGRITVERTLDWFDQVFPQSRAQGTSRILYVVTGILTVLVIVCGTFVFYGLRKSDAQGSERTVHSEVRPVRNVPSLTMPPAGAVESFANPSPDATNVPGATVPLEIAPSPATLFESVSRVNGGEITVTAAQADVGMSQAQLEIALASHSRESVPETRNRILQASAKVSQAAYAAMPTLQRFSIRVLLRGRDTSGAGVGGIGIGDNANLVFVGETSAIGLRTLSTTSPVPDYSLLSALFTNTWWANNLNARMP